jgi:hypothetical protein
MMSFLQQKGQLASEQLRSQIPTAQDSFNQLKGNTEATIADLIRGGEMQKSQTEDYYGDVERQSAKTLRDTQAQQQRTFANLGTLDSFGEGSFAEANTNVMSDFNRTTQQNLKAKADKLTEIDMNVRSAERSARQVIVQEEAKMNDMVKQIQFAISGLFNCMKHANLMLEKQVAVQEWSLSWLLSTVMYMITTKDDINRMQNMQNKLNIHYYRDIQSNSHIMFGEELADWLYNIFFEMTNEDLMEMRLADVIKVMDRLPFVFKTCIGI